MSDTIPRFELINASTKRPWVLFLHPDRLILTCHEKDLSYEVSRRDSPEKIQLSDGRLGTTLIVRADKAVIVKVTPEALPALREWLGPLTPRHLAAALKRRVNLTLLPLGALVLILSIPLRGNPGRGIPPHAFSPLWFALGTMMISMGVLSKFKPHRVLFLLDSIWMSALAGGLGYQVLAGTRSWFWAILVFVQVFMVIDRFVQYRRFAPEKMYTGKDARGDDQAETPVYASR